MARRKSNGLAGDVVDLIALLPWWAGLGLAALSYWRLHEIASRPLVVPASALDVNLLANTALWQGLATGGQYLLPILCMAGAAISALRRRKRKALYASTTASTAADALQRMSWQEFELLVGEGFRQQGFRVMESGGGGADGGVDLTLFKNGEKSLVQCKQWKAFKVGVSTVRELYGVMAAEGAGAGYVITSGRFTQEAVVLAKGRNIQLMDGSQLMQHLRSGQRRFAERTTFVKKESQPTRT